MYRELIPGLSSGGDDPDWWAARAHAQRIKAPSPPSVQVFAQQHLGSLHSRINLLTRCPHEKRNHRSRLQSALVHRCSSQTWCALQRIEKGKMKVATMHSQFGKQPAIIQGDSSLPVAACLRSLSEQSTAGTVSHQHSLYSQPPAPAGSCCWFSLVW